MTSEPTYIETAGQYVWIRRARLYLPVLLVVILVWAILSRDDAPPTIEIPEQVDVAFSVDRTAYPRIYSNGSLERDTTYLWVTNDLACAQFNGRWWKIDEVIGDAEAAIAASGAVRNGNLFSTVKRADNGRIEVSIPGHGTIAELIGIPSSVDVEKPSKCIR
jgi:hypothetical protein